MKQVTKRMTIVVPHKLFADFHAACMNEYKTASEVIRNFMLQYVKDMEHENDQHKT